MAEYKHQVIETAYTPTSDGTYTWDLPTEPISHLIVRVKCLNAGSNTKATLAQILGAVEKIEIANPDFTVFSLTGFEMYVLSCLLLGHDIWQENVINTDNAVRVVPLIIPFGKKLYNPHECYPAQPKAETNLKITYDIADTGYDNLSFHIEAVTLPDANPTQYIRATRKRKTPSSTGEDDVDFSTGIIYRGILMYSTTIRSGTSDTNTIDYVKLLLDNKEHYISQAYWEELHAQLMLRLSPTYFWANHFHMENTASSYTQNADTESDELSATTLGHYAYIDFDPTGDDSYLLDTTNVGDMKLRVSFGDTNEAVFIPIELVKLGAGR